MIKVYENSSEPKFPDVRSGYLERGFFPYCITFYEERSNNKVSTFGSVDVEYIKSKEKWRIQLRNFHMYETYILYNRPTKPTINDIIDKGIRKLYKIYETKDKSLSEVMKEFKSNGTATLNGITIQMKMNNQIIDALDNCEVSKLKDWD